MFSQRHTGTENKIFGYIFIVPYALSANHLRLSYYNSMALISNVENEHFQINRLYRLYIYAMEIASTFT